MNLFVPATRLAQNTAALLSLPLILTSTAIGANPVWQGRPFVKVVEQGDPIPGSPGATFGEITRFTLRDGTLHVVAGESFSRRGLFRWRGGQFSKLVYRDTKAPTGSTFDTVYFTTDETGGALNFVAEVQFGRPGAIYGLFQWKDGVITTVFDTANPVGGKSLLGFGYPVRVGTQVVGSSQFSENGVMRNGILRWDGTTLHTVIQSDDDLPGSLGGFTGQPGQYQIAFDGQNVAFVASDDPRGQGATGVYRAAPDGVITKVIDGNDKHPSNRTYSQRRAVFNNVDLDGGNAFYGINVLVSAAGDNSFYTSDGVRYTGGTFSPATGIFGTDGKMELVLVSVEPDGITPVLLDGEAWNNIELVDGQGDDVAFTVRLANGKLALYAAIGATVTPPVAPVLGTPGVVGGKFRFRFPSLAGKSYRVEFKAALGEANWTSRGEMAGTGADLEFSEAVATAGYYRVVSLP
jgi:hypothetical protein